MITLSNIFSRDKTLFYFNLWNDSDRLGYKDFLDYEVKNNLFIVPYSGQRGSVWYSNEELSQICKMIEEKSIKEDFKTLIFQRLDTYWPKLEPYLIGNKKIISAEELSGYYENLVKWWSAMSVAFFIPDMAGAPENLKKEIVLRRSISEKYTEKMSKVFSDFWLEYYSDFKELLPIIKTDEAVRIANGTISNNEMIEIRKRLNGCFMLNEKMYPFSELNIIIKKNDLELEEINTENIGIIKGRSAYSGIVVGRVKIIKIKNDIEKITEGDVLVTEMTNPDYVPLMQMASAIITDEGGIMCHAAIVSRELKKPCIIGTKIATKVLKDGDMVEVDAENGIIRLIK